MLAPQLVAGTQGELLVTDDGLEFEQALTGPVSPADGWSSWHPVATDVGFFASFLNPAQTDLSIVYSTNGIEWQTVQPPPIWPQPGEPLPFASDTVMTIGDDLVAFVHRGDVEGWGVVEDPTTEIWRAALPSLEGS